MKETLKAIHTLDGYTDAICLIKLKRQYTLGWCKRYAIKNES